MCAYTTSASSSELTFDSSGIRCALIAAGRGLPNTCRNAGSDAGHQSNTHPTNTTSSADADVVGWDTSDEHPVRCRDALMNFVS